MSHWNLVSLVGCCVLATIAWIVGGCARPLPWRTVRGSALLLVGIATLVFTAPPVRRLFLWLNDVVVALLAGATSGGEFVLGPLAAPPGGTTAAGEPSIGFILAAQVFPAVIFFASLMALLYHWRLLQPVVRLFARLFRRSIALSGAESLAGASYVFFGVESATAVAPYLSRMTRSELLLVLTCGMSTVASTTMAIYVFMLQESFPRIAGHLLSASVLSIPAAALVAKLMLPERETPRTLGEVPPLGEEVRHQNGIAALAAGAWDGLRLAAGIATMLIAVLGVFALLDLGLRETTGLDAGRLLGWLFTPFAILLGIPPADWQEAGRLLGGRLVLTEVFAYRELAHLSASGALQPRTLLILSYALCGFTHVASLGIFVGGIGALAPDRRGDLAALGPRALIGAALATMMTGALAGAFYFGQAAVL